MGTFTDVKKVNEGIVHAVTWQIESVAFSPTIFIKKLITMAILTITYAAKCKDCIFMERYKKGNLIRHRCTNKESEKYQNDISPRCLACNKWKLY